MTMETQAAEEFRIFCSKMTNYGWSSRYLKVLDDVAALLVSEPWTSSVSIRRGRIIEHEPKRGHNQYTRLAAVPLWRHSLDTAIALLLDVPTRLRGTSDMALETIAALGHDAGKLLAYRSHEYKTAEHPIVGARIMSRLTLQLTNYEREVINDMIAYHHQPGSPQGLLARRLAAADRAARAMEARGACFHTGLLENRP